MDPERTCSALGITNKEREPEEAYKERRATRSGREPARV